jgi:hypothetical protein
VLDTRAKILIHEGVREGAEDRGKVGSKTHGLIKCSAEIMGRGGKSRVSVMSSFFLRLLTVCCGFSPIPLSGPRANAG